MGKFEAVEVHKLLVTPLGNIEVLIDNKPISYDAIECKCDRTCMGLDGRYYIKVELIPDGQSHEIQCCIKNHIVSSRDGIESGERLELKSFYHDLYKLSIGMEGDSGYLENGIRIGDYDYDNEYTDNGVKYMILPDTKTSVFIFGIAWIDNVNDNNDVQTWYGADPTLMQ